MLDSHTQSKPKKSKVAESKRLIRKQILSVRDKLSKEEITARSATIMERVISTEAYQACKVLFTYINIRSEVETIPIVMDAWRKGKIVAVPVAVPKSLQMFFVEIKSLDALTKNKFGCLEPEPNPHLFCQSDANTFILVPGLAFDTKKYRVGYGGGYYDAFLAKNICYKKIGLAYNFQIKKELPLDAYDVPVDEVITDGGLF